MAEKFYDVDISEVVEYMDELDKLEYWLKILQKIRILTLKLDINPTQKLHLLAKNQQTPKYI